MRTIDLPNGKQLLEDLAAGPHAALRVGEPPHIHPRVVVEAGGHAVARENRRDRLGRRLHY